MGVRVLIVDDDIDLQETVVRLLGRFGYICLTASSGAEAMQVYDGLRHLLRDELGMSPSAVTQELHKRLLRASAPSG